MKFKQPHGATPLNDTSGLIPKHITTFEELSEWEQSNILKAKDRFLKRSRQHKSEWLDPAFIKEVHHEMFNETWEWAGKFRTSDANLGISWHKIPIEIKKLCDDIQVWPKSTDAETKICAVTLHYRLTVIHPFLNGNGRHARLIADIFMCHHDYPIFPWGACPLHKSDLARQKYLSALKEADQGKMEKLIQFAESTLV